MFDNFSIHSHYKKINKSSRMYSSSLLLFFPLFFLQLDDLKAGSSTSPNLEGTSVAPAGHRDGKEKLSQLIRVLRIDKQFDN
jgi:hypothetical protein